MAAKLLRVADETGRYSPVLAATLRRLGVSEEGLPEQLREAAPLPAPPAPDTPKAARPTRVSKALTGQPPGALHELRAARAGTRRVRVMELADGTRSLTEIGAALEAEFGGAFPDSLVASHLFCLRRDCAVGYVFDDVGRPLIVLPPGATMTDAVVYKKSKS